MTTKGYELYVNRGESFTLRYTIKLRDGSDFKLPSLNTNSQGKYYYLLKIASSKYEQEGRYARAWLINIKENNENVIEKAFDILTTSEWVGQHYLYSIDLVLATIDSDDENNINILDSIAILPSTKMTVVGDIQGGNIEI